MQLFAFKPKQKIESFDLTNEGFKIQARNVGLIGSVLSMLGIGAKSFMEIDRRGAAVRSTTISGETRAYIPLGSVAASVYRHGSPLGYLAVAGFFLLMGLPMFAESGGVVAGGILLFLAAAFTALYFVAAKTVTIGVITGAGTADTLVLEARGEQLDKLIDATRWLESAIADAASGPVNTPAIETAPAPSRLAPSAHTVTGSTTRSGF